MKSLTRRSFTGLLGAPFVLAAAEMPKAALGIDLGAEQLVAPGVPWPYLFQAREGTTVVFGHIGWPPGGRYPIHYTSRSFDGRKTWQEWKHGPEHGRGPITEGSAVQLRDGRCLLFDVHAEHVGNKRFETSFWTSKDAFRTLQGPAKYSFVIPEAEVNGFDDRGEPISRLYLRRSVIELKGGDLLATAYGHFEPDKFATEYMPKMFKMRSFLLRSKNEGRTWDYVSTIASGPVEQEGFCEPAMVQLQRGPRAGRIICVMRTGRENPIYQCESDDEGKTWTKAHPLQWTYSKYGRSRPIVGTDPDIVEMQDGTLAMAFGHKPDYQEHGNYLAFSVDHGQSWTQVTPLSSTVTAAYCGVREVSPGELFVVYTTSDAKTAQDYKKAKFNTMGRAVRVSR
ncbi:MAG: sialidase family protein [Bryobacteraceae bacterium]